MREESGASVFIDTSLEWGLERKMTFSLEDQSGVDHDRCGGPLHIC